MKFKRVLAGGTALMFLIGGGAMTATTTHVASASVSIPGSLTGTTTTNGPAAEQSVEVLAKKKKHKKKKHHKKRHHKKNKKKNKKAKKARGMSVFAGTTRKWAGAVNTSSVAAVNGAYKRYYASGMRVPTGYAGDDSRCELGANSAASLAATRNAVNFVRSLGGLAPISFNAGLNARSQRTALMMSAQRQLSHAPSSAWRCYTGTGAYNAGKSNLAIAYPSITSASVVGLYMEDPGAKNFAVGHRRWLMNPFSTQMGSGSTNTANSITVIGPSSSARPNPGFVAWPSAGYFPNALEPSGRWSISAGNKKVSFANASVTVYRNGVRIPVTKSPIENGYAQPTMVFNIAKNVAKSGTFTVVVRGMKTTGKPVQSYSYTVRMFTPN